MLTKFNRIDLPDGLRQQVMDDIARLKSARASEGKEVASVENEITSLEQSRFELGQRRVVLTAQALSNDAAAAELGTVERRLGVIDIRLAQLRTRPLAAVDLTPTYRLLYMLISYWREQVKSRFLADLKRWGVEEHTVRVIIGEVPALRTLTILSDWLSRGPSATPGNLSRLDSIYQAVLRGEADLSRETQPDPTNND